jgi:hypothetical protein
MSVTKRLLNKLSEEKRVKARLAKMKCIEMEPYRCSVCENEGEWIEHMEEARCEKHKPCEFCGNDEETTYDSDQGGYACYDCHSKKDEWDKEFKAEKDAEAYRGN